MNRVHPSVRYGVSSWFRNFTVKSKAQILSLVKTAGEIMGIQAPLTPQDFFEEAPIRWAGSILSDSSHVLHSEYVLLKSGGRYRVPLCKHDRDKHSLIPLSVKLIMSE